MKTSIVIYCTVLNLLASLEMMKSTNSISLLSLLVNIEINENH